MKNENEKNSTRSITADRNKQTKNHAKKKVGKKSGQSHGDWERYKSRPGQFAGTTSVDVIVRACDVLLFIEIHQAIVIRPCDHKLINQIVE